MTEVNQTLYVAADEDGPTRAVTNKRFIPKVMFLAAVMRPVFTKDGETLFSGKIGLWPIAEQIAVARSSHRRAAGTMETKSVTVNRDEHRKLMVDKVIPEIKRKVPWLKGQRIVIQQDGARAHVKPTDPAVVQACKEDGWNFVIDVQPPNSPDLNILDLSFFVAIQSLQYSHAPTTVDELIEATCDAFDTMAPIKLDNNFISLQQTMECVIAGFSGNVYKRPHMGKDKLRAAGRLSRCITCDEMTFLTGASYHL